MWVHSWGGPSYWVSEPGRIWRRVRLFLAIVWRPLEVGRMDWRTAWAVAGCLWGPREDQVPAPGGGTP